MRLRPFRALRPAPGLAARVAAPPYDVVSRDEARRLAAGNPRSFLHIGRPDIDLPEDVDPYDPRVYATGRQNLDGLVADGTLLREAAPAVYVYRQVMDDHAQTGVAGCVDVEDYERGLIRKHETTRPDKEDDRTRHVLALGAHAEPVMLMYRGEAAIDALVAEAMAGRALCDLTAPDGVRHTIWRAPEPGRLIGAFAAVPLAYVADGHHRSASAWRAARERQAVNPRHRGDEEYNWFLAVLFPARQLRILPYNRVLRDLGDLAPADAIGRLASVGRLTPTRDPAPPRPASFCIYLDRRWHLLELDPATVQRAEPVRSLDVSLLQERVLGPVFGILDQRTDMRIEFVGGGRGTQELEARVHSGQAALAISMHPVTVDQLMTVADAGQIMPPKSTWFEPKLASGLLVHPLD